MFVTDIVYYIMLSSHFMLLFLSLICLLITVSAYPYIYISMKRDRELFIYLFWHHHVISGWYDFGLSVAFFYVLLGVLYFFMINIHYICKNDDIALKWK